MNERRAPSLAFTEFERALLRSADTDEAPDGAAARALVALGVGTSHTAVSQSAGGANGAAVQPSAAWSLWQKPLLIGVLGGVGVALSTGVIDGPPSQPAPAAALVSAGTSATTHAARSPSPLHPPFAARHTKPLPPQPVRARPSVLPAPRPKFDARAEVMPAPVGTLVLPPPAAIPNTEPPPLPAPLGGAGVSPGTAPSSSIAAEVMVVDRAREALREGRTREALAELGRYREQWPLGVLMPEVTVLQIEAELRLGARDAARRRARDLVAAQPNSRYAARLRKLFDESELK